MALTINYSDIAGGDNDYATVALWETGTDNDLVTADQREIANLFAANSPYDISAFFVFGGATTDATRYRELRAESGDEHDGTKGSGARMRQNNSGHTCVKVTENYFRVTNLELDGNDTGAYGVYPDGSGTKELLVSGCLIYSLGNGGVYADDTPSHSDPVFTLRNSAFFNCVILAVQGVGGYADQYVCEYVSAVRQATDSDVSYTGFRYCKVTDVACFHYGGTSGHADFLSLDSGSSNYASSDTSGSAAGLRSLSASSQFADLTDNDMDLSLKSGSDLEGEGTAIAGVTTDWEGDTRDASTPDIGWDEYAAGAPSFGGINQIIGGGIVA